MLYALHDSDPELKRKGAFPILKAEAPKYNQAGYGIFWTPNVFKGQRKADNLLKIRFWIADIDEGSKEEQLERIKALPIIPNYIVETKKGYHCYWRANDATLDNYREIEQGLIKRLNADPACKDVCRLLRYPNYYHCKNPLNRFLVRIVDSNSYVCTEEQMLFSYRLPRPVYKHIDNVADKDGLLDPQNWNKIFKLDQAMAEGRNNFLSRVTFWLRDAGFDRGTIENTIWNMNSMISKPLDDWEVKTILRTKL